MKEAHMNALKKVKKKQHSNELKNFREKELPL
jgi:hypothetical protein